MRPSDDHRGHVKSLSKVLGILECFSRSQRSLSLADIAARTGLPKATTHRLLASLKSIGFIEQHHGGEQYRLGMKLFELGSVVLANMDLPREAQPFVDKLAAMAGSAVHLCVFDGSQAVFVDRRRPDALTRNTLTLLEGAPVHCTAVGKAILAFQPGRAIERIVAEGLTRFTDKTLTTAEALRAELAGIRQRGWAVDDGEHVTGQRCLAAPIRGGNGQVIAAISVSGPANLIAPEKDEANSRLVCAIAGELSRRLGYAPETSAPQHA